jgi:hypothetical protein
MGAFFRSPRRIGPLSHLEQFQIVSRLVARYLPRIRAEILALYS